MGRRVDAARNSVRVVVDDEWMRCLGWAADGPRTHKTAGSICGLDGRRLGKLTVRQLFPVWLAAFMYMCFAFMFNDGSHGFCRVP